MLITNESVNIISKEKVFFANSDSQKHVLCLWPGELDKKCNELWIVPTDFKKKIENKIIAVVLRRGHF